MRLDHVAGAGLRHVRHPLLVARRGDAAPTAASVGAIEVEEDDPAVGVSCAPGIDRREGRRLQARRSRESTKHEAGDEGSHHRSSDARRSKTVHVPEAKNDVPETRDDVPETRDDVPETRDEVPETRDEVPETRDDVPETRDDVPETRDEVPETRNHEVRVPETRDDVPETRDDVPGNEGRGPRNEGRRP